MHFMQHCHKQVWSSQWSFLKGEFQSIALKSMTTFLQLKLQTLKNKDIYVQYFLQNKKLKLKLYYKR